MKTYLPQLNGLLLLDKPKGITSNAALMKAKHALQQEKIGHGGTLDPLASGLLPLFFGSWTKLSSYCLTGTKEYRAIISLGVQTDTGDKEGRTLRSLPAPPIKQSELDTLADAMIGKLEQVPPAFSAVKVQGVPSYKLAAKARASKTKMKEHPPRWIEIHQLSLRKLDRLHLDMKVTTSKGAYVRTLAETIAQRINTCGHLVALRRTKVNHLSVDESITLRALRATGRGWIEIERLLPDMPHATITHQQQDQLGHGSCIQLTEDQLNFPQGVKLDTENCATILALSPEGEVVALGKYFQQSLKPERVLAIG